MASKMEGRVDNWWVGSFFAEDGRIYLYGDFYGLTPIVKEGDFTYFRLLRLDMVNRVAEIDLAYIKLGNHQDLHRVLDDLASQVIAKKGGS